jgi:membrane protein DedA with SNARE-associated domain
MPEWLEDLLGLYGYPILFLAVFLNNAGVPIPGDTVLLGSGFLAEEDMFSLRWVILIATLACFLGACLGYWVGRSLGRKIILRSRWLRNSPERIEQMEQFFKKHGPKAIFFARFVALLHPITGLLAGMGKIPLRSFLFYNLLGSAAYATCYGYAGYFFGESWDLLKGWVGKAALTALGLVVLLAFLTFLFRQPFRLLWARLSGKPFPRKKG